ncbi:hypothetical protein ACSAEA_005039 [Enterobacter roggenkampii]
MAADFPEKKSLLVKKIRQILDSGCCINVFVIVDDRFVKHSLCFEGAGDLQLVAISAEVFTSVRFSQCSQHRFGLGASGIFTSAKFFFLMMRQWPISPNPLPLVRTTWSSVSCPSNLLLPLVPGMRSSKLLACRAQTTALHAVSPPKG